jgi:hypothetical protein
MSPEKPRFQPNLRKMNARIEIIADFADLRRLPRCRGNSQQIEYYLAAHLPANCWLIILAILTLSMRITCLLILMLRFSLLRFLSL